ncbi:MAG: hypothetical protein R3248_15225 [Candidatus Promineifilaceae bacterium]|nr:hypothetical protein [Candidatus Promineifilaceae bacterium]
MANEGDSTRPTRDQYRAYLLRLWRDGTETPWRIMLKSVPAGEQHSFTDLESLFLYLDRITYPRPDSRTTSVEEKK